MIAANEAVAEYISNMDLPFIYRVHDLPNDEKIEDAHDKGGIERAVFGVRVHFNYPLKRA